MEQKLMKKKNARIGGFTLIEMVVVIAVIGVLMTLAFRGTGAIQGGARDVKRVKALNDAKAFLEQYYAANGAYPISDNSTCDPADNGQRTDDTKGWSKMVKDLDASEIIDEVSDIQNDPTASKQYCYSTDAKGDSYRIGAMMERKVPNDTVNDGTILSKCTTVADYFCVKP